MQSITFEQLTSTAAQIILDQLPARIRQAFINRATAMDYPIEAPLEMALAGYLDSEAIAFADCKPDRGKVNIDIETPLLSESTRLHQDAMALVDQAVIARNQGNLDSSAQLTQAALAKEQAAADLLAPLLSLEPSRSVLHHSAASLAIACSELRIAEQLINRALAGNPPADIADELRDLLLTEIYPKRQLLSA
jgi:hypothetical protein